MLNSAGDLVAHMIKLSLDDLHDHEGHVESSLDSGLIHLQPHQQEQHKEQHKEQAPTVAPALSDDTPADKADEQDQAQPSPSADGVQWQEVVLEPSVDTGQYCSCIPTL